MDLTPTIRRLVARAADQVVREMSRTPVAGLQITSDAHATPWISVSVQLGNAGGVRYIRARPGMRGTDYSYAPAPGLIEAIAKQNPAAAIEIVERIIEAAVAQAVAGLRRAG